MEPCHEATPVLQQRVRAGAGSGGPWEEEVERVSEHR